MNVNIWYLLTAIISKLKNNHNEVDEHVWRLFIAGIIGMIAYILAFIYLCFWVWYQFKR
jgi:uncharacterized membrane protein HdeD (DUF308 family)